MVIEHETQLTVNSEFKQWLRVHYNTK